MSRPVTRVEIDLDWAALDASRPKKGKAAKPAAAPVQPAPAVAPAAVVSSAPAPTAATPWNAVPPPANVQAPKAPKASTALTPAERAAAAALKAQAALAARQQKARVAAKKVLKAYQAKNRSSNRTQNASARKNYSTRVRAGAAKLRGQRQAASNKARIRNASLPSKIAAQSTAGSLPSSAATMNLAKSQRHGTVTGMTRSTEKFVEIDLGMDGAKWKHGYIPENAIAEAIHDRKGKYSTKSAAAGLVHVHSSSGEKIGQIANKSDGQFTAVHHVEGSSSSRTSTHASRKSAFESIVKGHKKQAITEHAKARIRAMNESYGGSPTSHVNDSVEDRLKANSAQETRRFQANEAGVKLPETAAANSKPPVGAMSAYKRYDSPPNATTVSEITHNGDNIGHVSKAKDGTFTAFHNRINSDNGRIDAKAQTGHLTKAGAERSIIAHHSRSVSTLKMHNDRVKEATANERASGLSDDAEKNERFDSSGRDRSAAGDAVRAGGGTGYKYLQAGGIGDASTLRLPEGHSVRAGRAMETHYDSAGKKLGTVYPKGGKDGPNALYSFNDKNGVPSANSFTSRQAAHNSLVANASGSRLSSSKEAAAAQDEERIRNAQEMYGTDMTKWPKGALRAAAKKGNAQAQTILAGAVGANPSRVRNRNSY